MVLPLSFDKKQKGVAMAISPLVLGLCMMVVGFVTFVAGLTMSQHESRQQAVSELLFYGGLFVFFAGIIVVSTGSPAPQPFAPAKPAYWLPGPTL